MGFSEYYDLHAILSNCVYSVQRVLIGVFLATLVGVPLGLFRSWLPPAIKNNLVIRFLFEAPKFPPPIAWIPFVILLAGIGELSAYLIVFIGAVSPIFIASYLGAESIPK